MKNYYGMILETMEELFKQVRRHFYYYYYYYYYFQETITGAL